MNLRKRLPLLLLTMIMLVALGCNQGAEEAADAPEPTATATTATITESDDSADDAASDSSTTTEETTADDNDEMEMDEADGEDAPMDEEETAIDEDDDTTMSDEEDANMEDDGADEVTSDDVVFGMDIYPIFAIDMTYTIYTDDIDMPIQTFTLLGEVDTTTDPQRQRMTMDASGFGDMPEVVDVSLEMVTVGDRVYMAFPEMDCISVSSEEAQFDEFGELAEAESILEEIDRAQRVRPNETINGIESRHYTFDEAFYLMDEPDADLENIEIDGHLYISAEDNRLVRIIIDGTNPYAVDLGDEGVPETARYTIQYDVRPLDELDEFEIPEGCEVASEGGDYPRLDDATNLSSMGGMESYTTGYSVEEAAEFLRAGMEERGYTYNEATSISSGGIMSMMEFNDPDGETTQVIVADANGETTVTIIGP